LSFITQQPSPRTAACPPRTAQPPSETSSPRTPAHALIAATASPPHRPETPLIAALEREADPEALAVTAGRLLVIGTRLFDQRQFAQATQVFAAIIEQLRDAPEPALRQTVVNAMSNATNALGHLGRLDEAIAIHEDMVAHFGSDALTAFDEWAKRCEDQPEPRMRLELATALGKKALVLRGLDRDDEALATLDDLIARFQDDANPLIYPIVAAAHDRREELIDDNA